MLFFRVILQSPNMTAITAKHTFFTIILNTGKALANLRNDYSGLPGSDEDGHGIGSQSIAFFARKYNAKLEYSHKDDWFRLRLLIPH